VSRCGAGIFSAAECAALLRIIRNWRTEKDLTGASAGHMKVQIALLARELMIAPTEEDSMVIRRKLQELRGTLARGSVVQLWLDVADSC
jgi:hypothetical protein